VSRKSRFPPQHPAGVESGILAAPHLRAISLRDHAASAARVIRIPGAVAAGAGARNTGASSSRDRLSIN